MDRALGEMLSDIYDAFRRGDWDKARQDLNQAHGVNYDHPEVQDGMRCCAYWKERDRRTSALSSPFEKGDFLVSQWENFDGVFSDRLNSSFERGRYALKHWVFHEAFHQFSLLAPCESDQDPDVLLRLAQCVKALGDYPRGVELLEKARNKRNRDAIILAELADLYALTGEIRLSKAFFREAFFINPSKIDIMKLESPMMQKLRLQLSEGGYSGEELAEWIPVYGVVYGIFTVKRELSSVEAAKLKQNILTLTHELQEHQDKQYLVPRLINHYFWLIDHMIQQRDNRSRIEELLEKVRRLQPRIYELYTN